MKKSVLIVLLVFLFVLASCAKKPSGDETETNYFCMDDPLGTECYVPSGELNFQNPMPAEYEIDENFELDFINQMPANWLLYRNAEYKINGVSAVVLEEDENKYVRLYSDGIQGPPYPQGFASPTFIFTTKFNLDQTLAGVAYGSLMVPTENGNSIIMGVSTGAVNVISVVVLTNMQLRIKVGGPFFYYSGNADGGLDISTGLTLDRDSWYSFRFEWDATLNEVKAFMVQGESEQQLYSGQFHISNRVNAETSGNILVPNVFKVTMPRLIAGYAYLDDVKVERKGELS
ncbi:MAG: hypothetical protein IH571_02340 [Acholeplasmataceae bacterium]|nr:hypothetical protein [Acholeplasmataceae bacterium]